MFSLQLFRNPIRIKHTVLPILSAILLANFENPSSLETICEKYIMPEQDLKAMEKYKGGICKAAKNTNMDPAIIAGTGSLKLFFIKKI